MAVRCPPVVNFMILAVGLLLVGYVIVTFLNVKPVDFGGKNEGFFGDSGAGDFCGQNSDCGSNRCGQLDAGKRRCF
jgi:hypothetical protein